MSAKQIRYRGVLAGLAFALVAAGVLYTSVERGARALTPSFAPDEQEVRIALHRVGLTPERLAACGASAGDAAGVVQQMIGYLTEHQGSGPFDAAVGEARAARDQLLKVVRSGQGDENDAAQGAAAESALVQNEAARTSHLASMFTAATTGLSEGERQLLAAMRANTKWRQPTEFLTIDVDEPARVRLRDALANERISAKSGEEPDEEAQAYLLELRLHPTVAAAKNDLDANLEAVRAAWEEAVTP